MVYAAYQGHVKNPRSEEQQLVRSRFAVLGAMVPVFLRALRLGLHQQAEKYGYTEGDHFMRVNWGATTCEEPGEVSVDFGALKLSEGTLTGVEFKNLSFAEESTVSVAFDSNSGTFDATNADKVYLFVYQPDTNRGVLSSGAARNAGTLSLTVPSRWSGMPVHVYGFVVGGDVTNMDLPSDTTYIGTGSIS